MFHESPTDTHSEASRTLEVLVRFVGFGKEEEEWLNVRKHVRQRSLPCESSECIVVLPGDLILCFQEGKEQALYFDAHVLDAQRRTHDVRGCRCRFLVRYDHDQSEEIVPLRKICRRPETDYRFQLLHSTNEPPSASSSIPISSSSAPNPNPFPSNAITIPTGPVIHPTLTSTSSQDPDLDPSLTSVSYPTPSTSVSVQNSIQVGDPEVKKIESDGLSASRACEALDQESIKNPSDASIIMEVKIEEGSIPKTCTKVEGEPMEVSTAPRVGND